MNMLKKRSRGYTSVSVLITVLVLALVMLLNTVFRCSPRTIPSLLT